MYQGHMKKITVRCIIANTWKPFHSLLFIFTVKKENLLLQKQLSELCLTFSAKFNTG